MGLVISDMSDPNCCEKIDYSYGAGCTYCARRPYVEDSLGQNQCCRSESESGSERIRAFLAETESETFVPDSDSDPVPDPVI